MLLSEKPRIELIQADCRELLPTYADNQFDLAIVDPPYGIGNLVNSTSIYKYNMQNEKAWNDSIPAAEYFEQVKRVSKNQIIWGANYYPTLWPSKYFICWDKGQKSEKIYFAESEIASVSIYPTKVFRYKYSGIFDSGKVKSKKTNWVERLHPCQKPIGLYEFCLNQYAKPGDKILDTHLGSGTHAVACYRLGYDLTAIERDSDYIKVAQKIFSENTKQLEMQLK